MEQAGFWGTYGQGIGDASPVEAGLTPVSQDVAPETAATAGERKGRPADKGAKSRRRLLQRQA